MNKLPKNLEEIITLGKNAFVAFKEAKTGLPKTLFQTVCSFSNRNGGHIFLGIKDDSVVTGVDSNFIKQMKKDFANTCNNPEKIEPPEGALWLHFC